MLPTSNQYLENRTSVTQSFQAQISNTSTAQISASVGSDFPGAYTAQVGVSFSYSRTVTYTDQIQIPPHDEIGVIVSNLADVSQWTQLNFFGNDTNFSVVDPNGNMCHAYEDLGYYP